HLRILDFGLAKLRDGPAMTAGMAVGTPSYMSPEQSGGTGTVDARTDLYAVGVLLFEILAGRKPFQSENVGELIYMHREAPPPLLRETAPASGYSAELEALLAKALSKMPEDRFKSAADFAAALAAVPEAHGGVRPGAKADAPRALAAAAAPAAAAPAAAAPKQWRLAWILGGFVLVVLVALSIGRGLQRKVGGTVPANEVAGAPAPAATQPSSAAATPGATPAPAAENPHIEQARQLVAAGQTPK